MLVFFCSLLLSDVFLLVFHYFFFVNHRDLLMQIVIFVFLFFVLLSLQFGFGY